MKRVTYWNDEYGCWSYHCSSGDAAKLLAAYEDTGLEPEEVLTGKELAEIACAMNLLKEYQSVGSIERFRELVQADRDGRLVVKPSTPAFLTREEVKAALKKSLEKGEENG